MSVTAAQVFARLGRNEQPEALVRNWRNFAAGEAAIALARAWTAAEWPERFMDPGDWAWLFDQVGFLINETVHPDEAKPDEVVLYRGALESRKEGMSWTDNPATARWFAHRFDGHRSGQSGVVYRMVATPGILLANFATSRGENEWVIDSTMLMEDDIEVVA